MKRNTRYRLAAILYFAVMAVPFLGALMGQPRGLTVKFEARHLALMANSLILGLLTVLLCVAFGFFAALYIHNSGIGSKWYRFYPLLLLPIPFFIYGLSWMYLIKGIGFFIPGVLQYSIKGLAACVFVEFMAFFPIAILMILMGMEAIDEKQIEMALMYRDDNRVVFDVILRQITPYIISAGGIILILSLTDFSVPSMFQYNTYTLNLFSLYSRTGSALLTYVYCMPLTLILIFPIAWILNSLDKFSLQRDVRGTYKLQIHGGIKIIGIAAAVVSVLQVVIPLIALIFTTAGIDNLIAAFGLLTDELYVSGRISLAAALLTIAIGYVPALLIAENKNKVLGFFVFASMTVPGAIHAMGILKFFNATVLHVLQRTVVMAAFGNAVKYVPFFILVVSAYRMRVDKRALELADIYMTSMAKRILLELRLMGPALLLGFMLVFFMVFAEEGIALILMAPGQQTITVKIYNYLHYGASEYVSALCLMIIVFIFLAEAILIAMFHTGKRKIKHDKDCRFE